MSPRNVFVTGIGIVSPAGSSHEATWASLLAGRTCVRHIDRDDLSGSATDFAGQVSDFVPPVGFESADRVCQFAVAAADEAMASAGISADDIRSFGPQRCRVSVGTSKGGILTFATIAKALGGLTHVQEAQHVPDSLPLKIPHSLVSHMGDIFPDAPARYIAERFGITGGMHTSVAACSTGTLAIIRAAQWIHDGDADIVICGSSDATLHPLWFGAFERMNVLATEHPNRGPGWACRPFDRSRDGFAMGEGAAILVLESSASVQRHDHTPMARISGYSTGSDPAGLTQLTTDGNPLHRVIKNACELARCSPDLISCIHAHGTGTMSNDLQETRAIRQFLGYRAPDVPIISLKGAIGHLLGAAGAVEIAASVQTCLDRVSPGTVTLLEPDPSLGPLTLPCKSFELQNDVSVLKTSLGFGGQLAAVIVKSV